ncbi:unannotated protein [freshwater metagenome]
MQNDFTLASINDDDVAIHQNVRQRGPDDGGEALFTSQNCGVRGRTAVSGDERANDIEIEQRGIGGREVSSDENERRRRLWNARGRNSHDSRDDAIGDICEISCTLGHITTRFMQSRSETGKGIENRTLSGGSAINPILHISKQHGVVGHQCQCIQNFLRESACLNSSSTKVLCGLTQRFRCTD